MLALLQPHLASHEIDAETYRAGQAAFRTTIHISFHTKTPMSIQSTSNTTHHRGRLSQSGNRRTTNPSRQASAICPHRTVATLRHGGLTCFGLFTVRVLQPAVRIRHPHSIEIVESALISPNLQACPPATHPPHNITFNIITNTTNLFKPSSWSI